ncbi:histidine protein methyltransferase 1 homolog [Caerostris extrusa]|uniref:protein-histidine N-methyltransferase n=1 Tax=Caerostris extrusa TaxID=172846 RepID=A0AAV4WFW6_CAEEX|nr:histidine protein methyltransferase 1 homolog [Caerostris extrusa]
MAFCFNFSNPLVDDSQINVEMNPELADKDEQETLKKECAGVPCEYISMCDVHFKVSPDLNLKEMNFGSMKVKYITQETIANKIENLDVFSERNSDLVPGKYEGGLKVWECSIDLAEFLVENNCIKNGDVVLELGCGIGLPGLIAYLSGALVTFQDFNSEVLKLISAPNVYLNTPEENESNMSEKCKFLSGDWQDIKKNIFRRKRTEKI